VVTVRHIECLELLGNLSNSMEDGVGHGVNSAEVEVLQVDALANELLNTFSEVFLDDLVLLETWVLANSGNVQALHLIGKLLGEGDKEFEGREVLVDVEFLEVGELRSIDKGCPASWVDSTALGHVELNESLRQSGKPVKSRSLDH